MIKLLQGDCMELMNNIPNESIDLVLTDIPYNVVNREDNGLRKLDKENADILTFDLINFLEQLYDKAKSTIIIFCGKEQVSIIHSFFVTSSYLFLIVYTIQQELMELQTGNIYGRLWFQLLNQVYLQLSY